MSDLSPDAPQLRSTRHARLFDLVRTESLPDEGQHSPARAHGTISPEEAQRIQQRAIDSLKVSRETPWPQRIFRMNRNGLQGA